MNNVFIGIGSNLSQPIVQVANAVQAINQLEHCSVVHASSWYTSKPMGPKDQPDYVNAVIEIETTLQPLLLLDALQNIEKQTGRIRKENRWGARIIDLDILLFNDEVINCQRLIVPHYGMKVREFVILPLLEIAPLLILPDGEIIAELANKIKHNDLVKQGQINWL